MSAGAVEWGAPVSDRDSGKGTWCVRADKKTMIVGRSPALLAALDTASRLAASKLPILIVGETGTGKELIARLIHQASGREGPLVDVDCGALPPDLTEAILFGHRRGAFTGAVQSSEGLIPRAHDGTLFLDELGSLPQRGQGTLLRALETGEVRPVGATRSRSLDFRVIATIQEDIRELVTSGGFRLDLMQRVAGAVIRVPPLSERREDIVPLARYFAGLQKVALSEEAATSLCNLPWEGNVRELKWTIERAVLFAEDGEISPGALRQAVAIGPGTLAGVANGNGFWRGAELRAACRVHQGDPQLVAGTLGIGRSTLYRWLKDEGLKLRQFKGQSVGAD